MVHPCHRLECSDCFPVAEKTWPEKRTLGALETETVHAAFGSQELKRILLTRKLGWREIWFRNRIMFSDWYFAFDITFCKSIFNDFDSYLIDSQEDVIIFILKTLARPWTYQSRRTDASLQHGPGTQECLLPPTLFLTLCKWASEGQEYEGRKRLRKEARFFGVGGKKMSEMGEKIT